MAEEEAMQSVGVGYLGKWFKKVFGNGKLGCFIQSNA